MTELTRQLQRHLNITKVILGSFPLLLVAASFLPQDRFHIDVNLGSNGHHITPGLVRAIASLVALLALLAFTSVWSGKYIDDLDQAAANMRLRWSATIALLVVAALSLAGTEDSTTRYLLWGASITTATLVGTFRRGKNDWIITPIQIAIVCATFAAEAALTHKGISIPILAIIPLSTAVRSLHHVYLTQRNTHPVAVQPQHSEQLEQLEQLEQPSVIDTTSS